MNESKKQCSEKVFPSGLYGSFHGYSCSKPATVERDGKWYCKIHDPEYVKAKDAKKRAKWDKKYKDDMERAELRSTAINACTKINPDNPQAVAESIEDMYEALKASLSALPPSLPKGSIGQIARRKILEALTKAEGKEI
jgi:uncharacterized Zn finger protein (UPF0148 family)